MIEAVTFDLWNTLILDRAYGDLRIEYLAVVLREQNASRDSKEIREAYSSAHDYAHKVWERENYRYVSTEERIDHMLDELNVELPRELKGMIVEEIKEIILRDPPRLIKGARETLEAVCLKYKMGLICDTGFTPGYVLRGVLERNRILELFTSTVFSDEVGFNKPHRIMFETALRELRANPSAAIHVGDLLKTDIAGAKAIGMKTIWINMGGEAATGKHAPDYEVSSLPEILPIISDNH